MKTNYLLAAAINGQEMVKQVGYVLVIGLALLVIWFMGKYFIVKFAAPPVVLTVWNGLFVLLGGFCIVNVLMTLIGHPLIEW